MPINFEVDWMEDIRQACEGDSFNWYGIEPAAAKKGIVFHHSGVNTARANEDGYSIAKFHVHGRGWGGCGYHWVITHDNNGPVKIQYVGDGLTWRAHVTNQNPGRLGICMVGNFEEELPGKEQLKAARMLVNYLLAPNDKFPSLNYFTQVAYHNSIPDQSTGCPGWSNPQFGQWFSYLQGGAFPESLYPPVQVPVETVTTAPVELPVTVGTSPLLNDPNVGSILDNMPEWELSWTEKPSEPRRVTSPEGADVYDFVAGASVAHLNCGDELKNIAGYFTVNGQEFARTNWSVDNKRWNGIATGALDGHEEPIPLPDDITLPIPKPTLKQAVMTLFEAVLGVILSPLRLIGKFKKEKE